MVGRDNGKVLLIKVDTSLVSELGPALEELEDLAKDRMEMLGIE